MPESDVVLFLGIVDDPYMAGSFCIKLMYNTYYPEIGTRCFCEHELGMFRIIQEKRYKGNLVGCIGFSQRGPKCTIELLRHPGNQIIARDLLLLEELLTATTSHIQTILKERPELGLEF